MNELYERLISEGYNQNTLERVRDLIDQGTVHLMSIREYEPACTYTMFQYAKATV